MTIERLTPYITPVSMRDVYEFGVCSGDSLCSISQVYNSKYVRIKNMFGFDSFCGLPEEQNDPLNQYIAGDFSAKDRLKTQSVDETVSVVANKISQYFTGENLVLIEGFFENTLKDEIVEKYNMGPASLINVDCDTYTSTLECLDFMFRNKLVKPGTVVRFDDWGSLNYLDYGSGESRAFKEISEKYRVEWLAVDAVNYGKPAPECVIMIFQVLKIGE
jgi:hypothetical protein